MMIIGRLSRSSAPQSPVPLVYEAKDQVKRCYGLGLTWAAARDEDDARAQAKANKASLYYFVPSAKQVAYTTHPDHAGYRRLHCAAAAALQKRPRDNFAAFYLLPSTIGYDSGYVWLVAGRNGQIVHDEVMPLDDAIAMAASFVAKGTFEKLLTHERVLKHGMQEKLNSILQSGNDPMMRPARRAVGLTLGERFPPIPAEAVGLIALIAGFAGAGIVYYGKVPDIQIVQGPERVTEKLVTLQNPVKAVPDPALFLSACSDAIGEALRRGTPSRATATCTAPTGTVPTWGLSVTFSDSPMQALSATLTLPPHTLIGSAETGLPPDQVVAALKETLAKAKVTVASEAMRAPQIATPAATAAPARPAGLGATPPTAGATPPSANSPRAMLQPAAAEPQVPVRQQTTVTFTTSVSPDYWSHRLKGLPLSITAATRAASGDWTIAAKVL
jgi:hypothetical protein